MTAAIICSFLSFRRSETAAVAAAEGGATEKKNETNPAERSGADE